MLCKEQNRLVRELKTAVSEHAQLVEQILALIRSDKPREGFQDLVLRSDSLYKGELGVALLAEELNRPEFAAMPFRSLRCRLA